MNVADDLRYTTNHEWARRADGVVTVGITDYAQDALGDIVFVDLPPVGRTVSAGDSFAEVESTKSVADVYAPVSGVVVAVNAALTDGPETINSDPYGDGWFVGIEASDPSELDALMDAEGYESWVLSSES